jgi:putative Mn2+ efflux pump MntP
MDPFELIVISVTLAMDATAASISFGVRELRSTLPRAAAIAAVFGLFQGGMPVIGWEVGSIFSHLVYDIDHWIAFILLSVIGIHMIFESIKARKEERISNPVTTTEVILIGIATSVDALIAGSTFAILGEDIMIPALVIGMVTFSMSFAAFFLGKRIGEKAGWNMELAGGVILILLGIRILVSGLL